MPDITIHTEYIKLDSFLKLSGTAQTGGDAKLMIQNQLVEVNGEVCTMRGKKLRHSDKVSIPTQNIEFRIVLEN